MPKDQPAAEERRESRAVPNVTPEKAEQQMVELQPQPVEAPEAPKSAKPGSHPLCPIGSDAQAASDLFFAKPEEQAERSGQKAVWDQTSYGAPVLHRF